MQLLLRILGLFDGELHHIALSDGVWFIDGDFV